MTIPGFRTQIRPMSLRTKLLIYAAVMTLFYMASTTIVAWINLETTTNTRLLAIHSFMEGAPLQIASSSLIRGTPGDFDQILKTVTSEPEITQVILFDNANHIFSTAQKNTIAAKGETLTFVRPIAHTAQFAATNDLIRSDNLQPGKPTPLGKLSYSVNKDALRAPAVRVFKQNCLLFTVATLLFGFGILAIRKSLNGPVTLLVSSLNQIEKGDLSVLDMPIELGSELNTVWQAQVRASKKIVAQALELHAANESLQARTHKLERQIEVTNQANIRLDNINAEKDAFVSHLMQEMETPVRGLLSSLEFIDAYIESARQVTHTAEKLNMPLSPAAIHNLRSMLQQLDVSHWQAKRCAQSVEDQINNVRTNVQHMYEDVALTARPIRFDTAFQEFIDDMRAKADRKNIEFTSRVTTDPPTAPLVLVLDWNRVALVMGALVENAIDFTGKGSVHVLCTVIVGAGIANVHIGVSDTGVGIDETTQIRLTELFATGAGEQVKTRSRIPGLSLDLSQRIARHMGASIRLIRSRIGDGSHFGFEFKAKVEDELLKAVDMTDAYPMRVMLVGGSSIEQTLFRDSCKRAGHHAHCVMNSNDAIRQLDAQKWDLVVTDHRSGFEKEAIEVVHRIREHEAITQGRRIPVILAATAENQTQSLKATFFLGGGNQLIVKPYSQRELRRIFRSTISDSKEA